MKIGIISDTHGGLDICEKVIKEMGDIDLLIHAGDTYRDAKYIKDMFKIDVIGVKGNTDGFSKQDCEKIFDVLGKRFFLTHGHEYGVKYNLDNLYYRALELGADIVVFGHSHIPLYTEENNIIFINPGSPLWPRGGSKPSYAILEIKDNKVKVNFKNIV